MKYQLVRFGIDKNPNATFGALLTMPTDGYAKLVAVTLELPWLNNLEDKSCIPAGTYSAARRWSDTHDMEVFELLNVPGRKNVELHIGNLPKDTKGCILLGTDFGYLGNEYGILRSEDAFKKFMELNAGLDVISLEIV